MFPAPGSQRRGCTVTRSPRRKEQCNNGFAGAGKGVHQFGGNPTVHQVSSNGEIMAVFSQGHSLIWGRALKKALGSMGTHSSRCYPKRRQGDCPAGFFPFLFQSCQFSLSSRVPCYAPEIAIYFCFSARNQLRRCSCRDVNEEFQPKNENKGIKNCRH